MILKSWIYRPYAFVQIFVRVFACNQTMFVQWQHAVSSLFSMFNGVQHGGIYLIFLLFQFYVRDLIASIELGFGCNIGGTLTS